MRLRARGRGALLVAVSGLVLLAGVGIAAGAVLVRSGFNHNPEGWTVVGDSTSGAPSYVATGGNPGGFIQSTDAVAGGTTYWNSPAKFLGDQSAMENGQLRFDLRQSDTSSQFDADDVILSGGGITIAHDTAVNPGTTFTRYRVKLRRQSFMDITGTPEPATKLDVRTVLGALASMRIRAEYRSGADTDDLDNVLFVEPAT